MEFDVIVIGAGLAGLSAALELAPHRRVALLAKGEASESASNRAQGGIAAPLAPDDSVDEHVRDTLVAGGGLCDPEATRRIVAQAGDAIAWLLGQGVAFTTEPSADPAGASGIGASGLHLTREGGHGRRRIVHAADATGRAVVAALDARARAHPNIALLEDHCAVDLIVAGEPGSPGARCRGVHAVDRRRGQAVPLVAGHVVLATGGACQVYAHTTTPPTATGDGIAMAWRAGCRVANMEFTQFHPTCLRHPQGGAFLISEAVRGEGGLPRLPDGTRFMPAHDPRAELAPRDIVARAIDLEIKRHGLDCVYLDISHQPREFLRSHFPNIYAHCLALGIDMAEAPIPVAPAAHYTCGGVVTDAAGRSDLPGLYAVGETACTGLHGANRLASNSLLECVVMGRAAAAAILGDPAAPDRASPDGLAIRIAASVGREADADPAVAADRQALRRLMSADAGIVRSDASLARAADRLALWRDRIAERCRAGDASLPLLELRNMVQVAELIVRAARARRESRGAHFNADCPCALEEARPTLLEAMPASAET